MKSAPRISKYMTPMPHTIGNDMTLDKARELMREFRIRHLPVQAGGKLVGILSERDVTLAQSFETGTVKLKVEDAMMPDPYTCDPDAELSQVALEMATRKYGSVIVQQANGKIVGIFTEVDGMRALGELLERR